MKNSPKSLLTRRTAGVLCHLSSLDGPEGVGTMGDGARGFVDWLADCGFGLWQILPLNPPVAGSSPYTSWSAFAANPLFIDLKRLAQEGLLGREDIENLPQGRPGRVDFAEASRHKAPLLTKAAKVLLSDENAHPLRTPFERFYRRHRSWLADAAIFAAIAEQTGTFEWWTWPDELKFRDRAALKKTRAVLSGAVRRHEALQFLFDLQWRSLRDYASDRGVSIVGDVPIYLARSCADIWARPELFDLDGQLRPRRVSGVPPDYFSATGQLWGHPVYDWDACHKEGFAWWIARLRRALDQTPLVRLDHFRGFSSFWGVPYGSETAIPGRWEPGPGSALFRVVKEALGGLPFIAEDLGDIDEHVLELRDELGLPGMAVLQFGFGGGADSSHLPHNHVTNQVVYTGTHDNDTLRGWLGSLDENTRLHVNEYFGAGPCDREATRRVLGAALSSVANWTIVPLQDLLGLSGKARMNHPGKASRSNWSWRCESSALGPHLCKDLRRLLALYARL